MRTGIIARKIGNSSYFNDDGSVVPVTVVKVDDCVVSEVKTKEKEVPELLPIPEIEDDPILPIPEKP